jgi:hypothetical protein
MKPHTENDPRARTLIAFAVDAYPGHAALRAFEASLTPDPLPPIVRKKILLPPPKFETPADHATKPT